MVKLSTDFVARVEAEPEVADVTTAALIPGDESPQRIEIDQHADASAGAQPVYFNRVSTDFFEAFDAPID